MGQTLSEPVTEKHSASGSSPKLLYAVSAMQGWRTAMEDAHTTELNLVPEFPNEYAFFAVFDGHGGPTVARLAGTQLHHSIQEQPDFKMSNFKKAIETGYLDFDATLRVHPDLEKEFSGCTAISALITPQALYVGNAGDSRAVLSVRNQVVPMSFDHKPENQSEAKRIFEAGGFLEYGRVNGILFYIFLFYPFIPVYTYTYVSSFFFFFFFFFVNAFYNFFSMWSRLQ
ncbi:Protein phosphatase 2C 2 [Coelomomyces lativittatus]|nr:Protein phosphatase 2C 2 [Coelomomyces lativittatus]